MNIKVGRSSIFNIVAMILFVAVLAGCTMPPSDEEAKKAAEAELAKKAAPLVIPVEASTPEIGDISTYFETSTRVEAERKVEVSSKGSARCIALFADEGDVVEQGDILAELDKSEAKATYEQTSVQVRQNKTAFDLAKRQFEEGLGTRIDMDNTLYAHEQSLATLETQKLLLENLTIRAPISGVVTARRIQEGMLISNGESVFSMMDPSSYMLAISPPEKELSRLKIGQEAEVRVDALPGKVYKAAIRRINPSVDPVTGTIKVVLDFEDELRNKLTESAFSRVKLVMSTVKDVVLVPKEAIVEENGKKYVFVLEPSDGETVSLGTEGADDKKTPSILTSEVEASVDNAKTEQPKAATIPVYTAKRVEVKTALEDSNRIQVFSGVSATDMMVTNGQHSLKDGAKVRITNIDDEIALHSDLSADELLEKAKVERAEAGGADDAEDGSKGKGGGGRKGLK